jgi:tripartite-type tricarboxylate transporter receptor subunit TctC
MKRRVLLHGAGALALARPFGATAQSGWPSKPITLIVPFPPGGAVDAFGRPLAAQLSKQLGRQMIIDNRGGAGGTVGASLAAKAPPDGYTFFAGAVHHAIAPSFYHKLDYDIEKDLVPITPYSNPPHVIVVNPNRMPVTDLKSFLELLRKSPGKYNFGSAGNGTSHHLAGELFKIQTKTFIVHIPYRGAGPALQDLIAGNIDMMFDGLGSSAQHIRAGRIRALALAAPQRSKTVPDVPTTTEVGLPSYQVASWYGMWGVKGTPREVLDRMHEEIVKALQTPELREVWLNQGSEPFTMSQADFATFLNAEIKRWADVTKASGAKLD